ncbi:MAG TPA: cytochrome b N-terminal domain-containing protein, partial [Tessaracoccus flavescens]|nr:cytochrome b N-terminal domain-containing protein [Tessaracoccus flavescens]
MAKPTTIAPTSESVEGRQATSAGTAPGALKWGDERLGLAKIGRFGLRKIFPDHWSFLLGEIALYSFIILLLTGVFLTIWFKPSMAEIEYDGSYQLLKGLAVSEAFASTLNISFDVRGGLLVRQIHHWAALLFVASATVHMLRVFFTGAFRKPREVNWLIGVGLLSMSLISGFSGYSL